MSGVSPANSLVAAPPVSPLIDPQSNNPDDILNDKNLDRDWAKGLLEHFRLNVSQHENRMSELNRKIFEKTQEVFQKSQEQLRQKTEIYNKSVAEGSLNHEQAFQLLTKDVIELPNFI